MAGGTRLPPWVTDRLLPLLTGDETKTYLYILRRTWGSGVLQTRIPVSQITNGRAWAGRDLDGGTGLTDVTVRRHIKWFTDCKLLWRVRSHKEREAQEAPLYRPLWWTAVDWERLVARANERAGAKGCQDDAAYLIPSMLAMVGQEEADYVPARWLDVVDDNVDYGVRLAYGTEEGKVPRDYRVKAPHITAGAAVGLSAAQVRELQDALIDCTDSAVLVNQGIQDNVLADNELTKAQEALVALLGYGLRTPEDIRALAENWRKSSWAKRSKSGIPSIAQLGTIAKQEAAVREQALATPPTIGQRVIDSADIIAGPLRYDAERGCHVQVTEDEWW